MDQTATNNKPYDLTTIYAITENNPQFLDKLLIIFSDTIIKDIDVIKAAAGQGNWSEVGQTAHKIKPSVSHFGINSLKDIISNLEHQGSRSIEQLNALISELEDIIKNVLKHLKDEFPATFN